LHIHDNGSLQLTVEGVHRLSEELPKSMAYANETKLDKTVVRFGMGMIACLVAMAMLAWAPTPISAQQSPTIAGDYTGTLGPLHVKLHLKVNPAGKVTGTLDSPDQGAIGIKCTDFHVDGQSVTFSVPAVKGTWKGTVAADGTLTGTWDQGSSLHLNFARDNAQAERSFNASL
jgi:D-alanyl-D-alanine-carboxypeptidase/D-alanyl-D-alanine-endopeptidase